MIPDLSLRNRLTALLLLIAIPVVLAAIIFFLVSVYKNTNQVTGDSEQIKQVSELLKVADSIRDSSPDLALVYYHKTILILQTSNKEKEKLHHLAAAYLGIANINSTNGDYKASIQNDSIAMALATQANDRKLKARAIMLQGNLLAGSGDYANADACFRNALVLADEIKDTALRAKIFTGWAVNYYYQGEFQKSINGFANALEIGKQLKNKHLMAGNYLNLALVFNTLSKNDSVLLYNKLALKLYIQLNDKNGELLCYQNIGTLYYSFADFAKAIENYQLSLNLALQMNDKPNIAKGYNNLAEVYSHLGDMATATNLIFKSIKIKEELNNKFSLSKGYTILGELYYNQKNFAKAKIYFEKALKLCLEINSASELGSCYSNLAGIYSAENKSDQAIAYYTKALQFHKKTGYTYGISSCYLNLGSEYSENKGNYPLAEKYLLLALKSKKQEADEEGSAIVNHQLASLYNRMAARVTGDSKVSYYHKAESTGIESYRTAKRIGTIPVMRDASKILKTIYQDQGKYTEALRYSDLFISLNDSLLNKAKVEALTFAEARWNVEKKQQEIARLENAGKLQQAILKRKEAETARQKLIIWFIISFFLLSAIAVLIIALYIRKRRDAIYQKQLANITALRMQNVRNTMSPHFFFNVLASLSGLSHQPEQLKEKLNSLSLLLRKMIENIDRTVIPLDEELAAVKAYIELFQVKMPEPILIEYCIKEGTNLQGLIPAMMIQIPVENAIKHGLMPLEGEKKLSISITDFERHQQITVTDNGIGLKASAGRSTGTGTGLKVLLQTIHLLNAGNLHKIKFAVSELENTHISTTGTSVNIEIPYNFNYSL
jgi:tetratricopeptide (TPR) repeat protein